ncbi:unnamed protein product [Paramecium sonneborni]|uniref:Uncharacterized protein n=1 Tax=Paramecium sonneborni TaxID=65129 RepID=A0A8S1RDL3_9CILI|nr:unnamed protein product [Paramecium sonneborni]
MLNIKIVYQRKVHKLPPKIKSYQEIVEAIMSLYPQIKKVYLYAIIKPSDPNGAEEITCELALNYLKKMYNQMGWPTIKLLVLENQNDQNQLRNSIDLLNQSQMILDKSNYLDKSNINKTTQKQVNDYRQDEKLKQILVQIIDERLRFYNLLGSSNNENEMIVKAKRLSEVFNQYSYDWILEFVKQQGPCSSYEKLVSLLTENQ